METAVARLFPGAVAPPAAFLRALFMLAIILGLLMCPREAPTAHASSRSPSAAVVALAYALLGEPYAYIGDDPSTGFSCIGFVHYLYARVGVDVPYDLTLAYGASQHVDAAHLQPGDLVFFSGTVWDGLSHVAVYAGDGAMIGADNYQTGVELTLLSEPYWRAHYTGATRPLASSATIPVAPPIAAPIVAPAPPTPSVPRLSLQAGERLRARAVGDVYSGPGYTYQRIDRLGVGSPFDIVQVQAGWANVVYHTPDTDYYGWVDAPYLTRCTITAKTIARSARHAFVLRVALVVASVLLVRQGPAADQPVVGRLTQAQRVTILDQHGSWDYVRAGHTAGWAFARWLSA